VSEESTNRYFDELARGLAENSISRRQAIRWAGYSVAGAALSSLGFAESAEALTRRQRRRCRRSGGIVCGETRSEEYCCREGTTCAGGDTCTEVNCRRGATQCPFRFGCQNSDTCLCATTLEGRNTCVQSALVCSDPSFHCTSSQDCPTGWVCTTSCCGKPTQGVCTPPCGTFPTGAASSAQNGVMSGR
jgi:hypothetical protein